MSRKKASKSARKNSTRHQRTVADPNVKARIDDLRLQWEELDPIERGDQLRKIIDCGCSTRGLGDALGISGTGVRRYMALAVLPEIAKDAVRGGFSAKKTLEYKAQADRQSRRQERVAIDKVTGEFSDRLADTILAFCRADGRVMPYPIDEVYLDKFLSEVRNKCCDLDGIGFRPPKLLKRHDLKKRFRLTRPPVSSDVPVVHLIEWLAVLILAEIPERQIWETAIDKAGKRSKEIRPKDTRSLAQKYSDHQVEMLKKKIISPPRRKY